MNVKKLYINLRGTSIIEPSQMNEPDKVSDNVLLNF